MAADGEDETVTLPRVKRRFTVEEFMAIAETKVLGDLARLELDDGEIIEMPSEGTGHARNTMSAYLALRAFVLSRPELEIMCDLAVKLDSGRVVGPDVVVIDRAAGQPTTVPAASVRLAVEAGWSSLAYDLEVKAGRYAAAGVPELWVLDGEARRLNRFRRPVDRAYVVEDDLGPEAAVEVPFAPGETIAVADLFDLS